MNTTYKSCKIAIIGAGSVNFCPATLGDICLSDPLNQLPLSVALMDIDKKALDLSYALAQKLIEKSGRHINLSATLDLEEALTGCDFVITAIEVERYHYWSIDFHIPNRYGFRQVYGENGGPGGMFHFLRNVGPILHIAHTMEKVCPDAFLINYTNPEAKLVEAVLKMTKIRAVGVCHGFGMGVDQAADILGRDAETLDVAGYGLNHFGFLTVLRDKATGKDLYPELREKEAAGHWLSNWDELGLSRVMFRLYGLWPYPGTNHIGEYMAWADAFLASSRVQYFFDPLRDKPWATHEAPSHVYSFAENPTGIPFNHKDETRQEEYERTFRELGDLEFSGEYGIPIVEGILYDMKRPIPSLNVLNKGQIPGIIQDMCVEGPCLIDRQGVHLQPVPALPTALEGMINQQGYIHRLIMEAYQERSRNKLLQAVLMDPTVSNYNNAVAMIDEVFRMEEGLIAPLSWK